tara:strand:+ start:116 stop:421 length:306 start_codon:yes stop_codon:yes gene_type:complete
MDKKDQQRVLEGLNWTFAKTYASFAPHEYIVLGKQPGATLALFMGVARQIKLDGVEEEFSIFGNVRTYQYLYLGKHKYWVMDYNPEDVTLINRVSVRDPAS